MYKHQNENDGEPPYGAENYQAAQTCTPDEESGTPPSGNGRTGIRSRPVFTCELESEEQAEANFAALTNLIYDELIPHFWDGLEDPVESDFADKAFGWIIENDPRWRLEMHRLCDYFCRGLSKDTSDELAISTLLARLSGPIAAIYQRWGTYLETQCVELTILSIVDGHFWEIINSDFCRGSLVRAKLLLDVAASDAAGGEQVTGGSNMV